MAVHRRRDGRAETDFLNRTGLTSPPAVRRLQCAGQPLSTADLWNWRRAADPRISPDGSRVV